MGPRGEGRLPLGRGEVSTGIQLGDGIAFCDAVSFGRRVRHDLRVRVERGWEEHHAAANRSSSTESRVACTRSDRIRSIPDEIAIDSKGSTTAACHDDRRARDGRRGASAPALRLRGLARQASSTRSRPDRRRCTRGLYRRAGGTGTSWTGIGRKQKTAVRVGSDATRISANDPN